jgi:hypothetical protein
MNKAKELLDELNNTPDDELCEKVGRIEDILTILDVIEHELLEPGKDYDIRSTKYNKLINLMRKEAFKEIPPLVDLAVVGETGLIFYITEILDNEYIINDMYGIVSLMSRNDVIDIFTDKNNIEDSEKIERLNTEYFNKKGEDKHDN